MPRKKRDFTPLPGFPIEDQFTSMDEVNAYLSGNHIQCRECGYYFSGLARHITVQHEMSADEYKEKHGIPWGRGLTSGALHNSLSELSKQSDCVSHIGDPVRKIGVKQNHRGYCKARINAKHVYSREVYFEFARRVAEGEPILSHSRDDGMPSVDSVYALIKKDKEFSRYWEANVKQNILPWQKAARENLAAGKVEKAIEMATAGASASEIAAATGYTDGNARLFLKGKNWTRVRSSKIKCEPIKQNSAAS